MKITLKLAALYNLCWGAWDSIKSQPIFQPGRHGAAQSPSGVARHGYGHWRLWYWLLAGLLCSNRHWPIVFVGLLGKVFGPLGFFINYFQDKVPFAFINALITNDFM